MKSYLVKSVVKPTCEPCKREIEKEKDDIELVGNLG